MSQYSHSHPYLPRTTPVSDYIVTKKPKSRKSKFQEGQRSKSTSPQKKFAQAPSAPYVEPLCPPYTPVQALPHINEPMPTPSPIEGPVIVQAARGPQESSSQPQLYLIHPESDTPIELPPWIAEFRPRIPPLVDATRWESPIPRCESITHAILIREALTKFHFAVYLADEDAGESDKRFRQNLAQICAQYMPAMETLGIKKHQIVFFYHGRKHIRMGNLLWDAIDEWKDGQWRSKQDAFEMRYRAGAKAQRETSSNGWSFNSGGTGAFSHGDQNVRW